IRLNADRCELEIGRQPIATADGLSVELQIGCRRLWSKLGFGRDLPTFLELIEERPRSGRDRDGAMINRGKRVYERLRTRIPIFRIGSERLRQNSADSLAMRFRHAAGELAVLVPWSARTPPRQQLMCDRAQRVHVGGEGCGPTGGAL